MIMQLFLAVVANKRSGIGEKFTVKGTKTTGTGKLCDLNSAGKKRFNSFLIFFSSCKVK